MKLPATPQPGSPLSSAWGRDVVDCLRSLLPRGGPGVRVSRSPNGTTIDAAVTTTQVVGRSGQAAPFTLFGFTETDPAAAKITVAPGMVNNIVPTIGGTSLAAVPAPTITVTGASGQIWMAVTVDGAGDATAAVITNETVEPEDTDTMKHRLIGTWTASGGAFTSVTPILNANQTLYLCNGTAIWETA